jgi:hypothetical protein
LCSFLLGKSSISRVLPGLFFVRSPSRVLFFLNRQVREDRQA